MSNEDLDQAVSNQIKETSTGVLMSASPDTGVGQKGPDPGATEDL